MKETENNENQEIPKEENESIDNQEVSPETDVPKKKNFFKSATNFVASKATNIKDKVISKYESIQLQQAINSMFYLKCETFIVVELLDSSILSVFLPYELKAIRNAEEGFFYIKADEKILEKLKSGMTLTAKSDEATFNILEKDMFSTISVSVSIGTETYEVECYRIKVKLQEKKSPQLPIQVINNTTNNQQSLTVNGNDNQVNQSINVEQQLAQIEGDINKCKGGLFGGGKKKEAKELFGNFRDCVINQKKDEPLFQKFLKILGELSLTVAVEATKILIARIP